MNPGAARVGRGVTKTLFLTQVDPMEASCFVTCFRSFSKMAFVFFAVCGSQFYSLSLSLFLRSVILL